MRTTLDLNDDLLAEAKALAAVGEALPVHRGRGGVSAAVVDPLCNRPSGCGGWAVTPMTPDVNVLLAASRSDHPHRHCAIAWLDQALGAAARGSRLRLLPMVAAGSLRLATHARVFVEPTPLEAAQEFLAAVLRADGVEMLTLGGEWPLLEAMCREAATF